MNGGGGFFPHTPTLPSPAPSYASSRVAAARLPHPRSKPLIPGSRKEDYARDYVSRRLMHISRRYVKKHGIPDPADEVAGYESMDDVCRDLEEVVDVLWFSGTPSLQIPYLLNVALAFNEYLPSFPPSPRPTFALLKKLDHCFSSLLVGHDVKSQDPLPGFRTPRISTTRKGENPGGVVGIGAGGFSRTDMVRIKSLADEARMVVAVVMSGEAEVENYDDDDDDDGLADRPPLVHPTGVGVAGRNVEDDEMRVEEFDESGSEPDRPIKKEENARIPLPSTTAKRKIDDLDDDDDDGGSTDGVQREVKRIKVEEEEAHNVKLPSPIKRVSSARPNGSGSGGKGQFHWALDGDDDDDDDEDKEDSEVYVHPGVMISPTATTTTNGYTEERRQSQDEANDDDDDDIGAAEEEEEEEDEEDEDEELQMNVGKVYEKTLVQLGKSLGVSITDD